MRTVAVVQARMGSTRLPGKVLMPIGARPLVLWTLDAVAAVPGIDILFIGSNDLCTAMGIPGELKHPKLRAAFVDPLRVPTALTGGAGALWVQPYLFAGEGLGIITADQVSVPRPAFATFLPDPAVPGSLASDAVLSLLEDAQGALDVVRSVRRAKANKKLHYGF